MLRFSNVGWWVFCAAAVAGSATGARRECAHVGRVETAAAGSGQSAPDWPRTVPAEPRVIRTPISAALGLADVALDAPAGLIASAEVIAGDLRVPLRRVPSALERADGGAEGAGAGAGSDVKRERFFARVMAGAPAGDGVIRWVSREGTTHEIAGVALGGDPGPDERTPDWAKGAVWYQIFVERFRNGEPGNDPRGGGISTRPWNEPWRSLTADELEATWSSGQDGAAAGGIESLGAGGGRAAQRARNARRYGGDLAGIAEKLAELRGLGIDGLYLTPIFHARSAHKYDASDFRHIDPTFGNPAAVEPGEPGMPLELGESTDPATWALTPADAYFQQQFLPAVHDAGLRIILDGVWNHVGRNFWAFRDLAANGRSSAYASWFEGTFASGDPQQDGGMFEPGTLIGWRGWNRRNGELPTFARPGGNLAAPVKEHIAHVTRRWMNPGGPRSQRIDGWRLDVAPDVPLAYWKEWRTLVKSIDPDALLIGEVWYPAKAFFGGAAFDGQMNYPFAMPVVRFAAGDKRTDGPELAKALAGVFSNHPATDLVQLNLLGSHDTARLATMLHDPTSGYDQGDAGGGGPRAGRSIDRHARPAAETFKRVLLCVALQATMPGAPMVYYADEVGAFGANDPDCRKPYPWPDRGPYPAGVDADTALRGVFARWLNLRRDPVAGAILRYGSVHFEAAESSPDVLLFRRRLNDAEVLVGVNRGNAAVDLAGNAAWLGGGHWHAITPALSSPDSAITGAGQTSPNAGGADRGEASERSIPARSARIWLRRGP